MRPYEATLFTDVDRELSAIESRPPRSIAERQQDLATGLRLVVDASFAQARIDYAADIDALNADPRWARPTHRHTAAIPPKYFGGDPTRLVPGRYVLHISLNHAFSEDPRHAAEYAALTSATTHYLACAEYFERYWHGVFFNARARLMRAYEVGRGRLPPLGDAELLGSSSLFVERFPTWSRKLCAPAGELPDLFCLALNERVLRFVLGHFPPEAVLVTGNPALTAVNDWRLRANDSPQRWTRLRVPKRNGRRFKAGMSTLGVGQGWTAPAMRCGFIPSRSGPNHPELELVGQLLAGAPANHAWADGDSVD